MKKLAIISIAAAMSLFTLTAQAQQSKSADGKGNRPAVERKHAPADSTRTHRSRPHKQPNDTTHCGKHGNKHGHGKHQNHPHGKGCANDSTHKASHCNKAK